MARSSTLFNSVPDHTQSSIILNHYPQLGTSNALSFPVLSRPKHSLSFEEGFLSFKLTSHVSILSFSYHKTLNLYINCKSFLQIQYSSEWQLIRITFYLLLDIEPGTWRLPSFCADMTLKPTLEKFFSAILFSYLTAFKYNIETTGPMTSLLQCYVLTGYIGMLTVTKHQNICIKLFNLQSLFTFMIQHANTWLNW